MNAALDARRIDLIDAFDVIKHRLSNRIDVGLVSGLCGKAFAGKIVANEPTPTTADPFEGTTLIFHVRRCEKDRLELPFHVGEDRSRTWVLTRKTGAVSLKHDHRHKDGTPDQLTMYGGLTIEPGSATRQQFPADAETKDLFTRLNLPVSIPNGDED